MTHSSGGREAGDGTYVLRAEPRPNDELRRAQLVVARIVYDDPRTLPGWEKEGDLMEMLDALGLYRRLV